MAQYDYRCKACNQVTIVERSVTDPGTAVACSACGSREVVRIYNSIGMLGLRSSANLNQEPFSKKPDVGGGCAGGSCGLGSCSLN